MPRIDLPHVGPGRGPLRPIELIWVTGTSALILFLALTPQLFIIWPYFRHTPTFTLRQLLYALLPFNAGILAIFYNYHLCISTSPGRVPHDWEPDWDALGIDPPGLAPEPVSPTSLHSYQGHHHSYSESSSDEHEAPKPPTSGKKANPLAVPRFCKTCKNYKPPRAHHCKQCKACTLKMDHHCPWIANCVGHENAPHFLRFLYAVEFSIVYHFALISARIADYWSPPGSFWIPPGNAEMVLILLNYMAGLVVLLLVGVFCVYHTWLLCNGTTTIESSERDRVRTMVRRGRIREIRYPYDLGAYANICSVLGPTPLHWFIPGLQTQSGGGLGFAYRKGTPAWLPYAWPPRDPTHPHHSQQRISPSALRKRSELEQGWEWERNRVHANEEEAYASANAFTYGAERLNPALHSAGNQRRRTDIPAPEGLRTRVRRGSEGVEVKPRRFDLAFAHDQREWELDQGEGTEGTPYPAGPSPTSGFVGPPESLHPRGLPATFALDDEDDEGSGTHEGPYMDSSPTYVKPGHVVVSRKGLNYVSDESSSDGDSDDGRPIYLSNPAFPDVDMSEIAPLHECRRASVTQAEEVDESDAYMPPYGGEDGYGSPAHLSREQSVHSLTQAAAAVATGGKAMPEFALDDTPSTYIDEEMGASLLSRRNSSHSDVEAWLEGQKHHELQSPHEPQETDDGIFGVAAENDVKEGERKGHDDSDNGDPVGKAKVKSRTRTKGKGRRRRPSVSVSSSSSSSSSSSGSSSPSSSGPRNRSETVSTATDKTTDGRGGGGGGILSSDVDEDGHGAMTPLVPASFIKPRTVKTHATDAVVTRPELAETGLRMPVEREQTERNETYT
ncbi:hypothetical protein A4X13_0g7333 [Tilletia indica]|uniref:Palmitoyltransferase n=1 Tax=Tilletia indica TaxID=43049 RepID=A0A177TDN4_9BASI|nr:hypothetical protein A4X13_0g7333 [Tilletia indica]